MNSKIKFDNISATLCWDMLSLDKTTRQQAAKEAEVFLANLPKFLLNSPHCKGEIEAINTLIFRVNAE